MKVLILHQHFKTPDKGGAIRSYYLAKALIEAGHQVVVITGNDVEEHSQESIEGIEVHHLSVAYQNEFGFYKRGLSFLRFIWKAVALASKMERIDYCYAISVPLTIGIAAMQLKNRKKIPYFFEVGDLWPEAPIQMGFVKNSLFKKFLYSLEEKIYAGANAVVALSPMIADSVGKKAPGKKVYMIPNMADLEFYATQPKDNKLENVYRVEGKFVVSYIGAVGLANGLDYFLECARASQRAGLPVHFILCGDGAMLPNLKNSATRIGLNNLTFVPFQTRDGVRDIMNITDAAFVSYRSVPVLETGSPNKYFDGLAAGKLIVINFGGWIREEITERLCGIYIDPERPSSFPELIKPFLDDKNLLIQYQRRSRALAEERYSRKALSKAFANIFTGVN